jgi:hypothetical protein
MASSSNRQVFCQKEVEVSGQESINTIKCPFQIFSGTGCTWVGSPSEALVHSKSCHGAEVQQISGPLAVQLQNFSKYKNFHKAILMKDKLFYLLWVIKEDIMHFLVFVIPKDTSEEYAYDFKLQKGHEQIAITGGACGSFLHHEGKELKTGDIFRLHRNSMQNFVGENGELSCVIEIREKDVTPSSEVSCTSGTEEEEAEVCEFSLGSSEEEPETPSFTTNRYPCAVTAK